MSVKTKEPGFEVGITTIQDESSKRKAPCGHRALSLCVCVS